jgi:hypothetical protein
MDSQNVKVYLAISGALVVLLILIIIIPFSSKKTTDYSLRPTPYSIHPTTVQTNSSQNNQVTNSQATNSIPATFTGGIDEPVPQNIINVSNQKRGLQSKLPLSLSTFSIDFNYSEDKFEVTLNDPKDQAKKEFENWRATNYPSLSAEQFLIK